MSERDAVDGSIPYGSKEEAILERAMSHFKMRLMLHRMGIPVKPAPEKLCINCQGRGWFGRGGVGDPRRLCADCGGTGERL